MRRRRKPRDSFKYVYHLEDWEPSLTGSLRRLLEEGTLTSLEEYKVSIGDRKKYFCPRCGYPCRKHPRPKKIEIFKTRSDFRHFPVKEHRECIFRTKKPEGKKDLTESQRRQAQEDGRLTVIAEWLSEPDDNEFDGLDGSSRGVSEKDDGPETGRPISQETSELDHPRKINTLQFICDRIHQFLHQDIQLPDRKVNEHEMFKNVFIHASDIQAIHRQKSFLFWGCIERVCEVEGNLCICFGYEQHCLYLAFPLRFASRRGWIEQSLLNRYVVVAGYLRPTQKFQAMENNLGNLHRQCWKVVTSDWGAVGLIREDLVWLLPHPHPDQMTWVEPPMKSLSGGVKVEESIEPTPSRDGVQGKVAEKDVSKSELDGEYRRTPGSIPSDYVRDKPISPPTGKPKSSKKRKTKIRKMVDTIIESSPVKFARKISVKVFTPIGKVFTSLYNLYNRLK